LPWKGIIANAALYFVDRHVYEGRGDKAAFREYPNGRALSYGMLAVTSNKISGAFGQAGIAREERVEMLVLECMEFPQIF
jgi:4-hydroxybenzoate-CoA ligase